MAIIPMTRLTCANLRVFFWTPMLAAVWGGCSVQSALPVSIVKLELFGGAMPRSRSSEHSGKNDRGATAG
jgi:hypothetical protein